jgi:hypothetical protein
MQQGTRLRGDHPAVTARPAYFVLDGTPANEIEYPEPRLPDWDEFRTHRTPDVPLARKLVCFRDCGTLTAHFRAGGIYDRATVPDDALGNFSEYRPLAGPDRDELERQEADAAA